MLVFIFDFDDTIVNSTPIIHYNAYNAFCKMTNRTPLSLEEYYSILFDKTYVEFIKDMNLTPEEYKLEYENWIEYTSTFKPEPFIEVVELLRKIKAAGHKLVICSQSNRQAIEDFFNRTNLAPDMIIAGDREHPERNKPFDYPIDLVKSTYGVDNSQIYVVDDMKPGLVMAKNNHVKSIGVMYCGFHDMLRERIYDLSTVVAETISDLINFVKLLI